MMICGPVLLAIFDVCILFFFTHLDFLFSDLDKMTGLSKLSGFPEINVGCCPMYWEVVRHCNVAHAVSNIFLHG